MVKSLLKSLTPDMQTVIDAVAKHLGAALTDIKIELSNDIQWPVCVTFKAIFSSYMLFCHAKDMAFYTNDMENLFVVRSQCRSIEDYINAIKSTIK